MILFSFLLAGILLILGISRYNENEKLFWQLFVSFIGAFAATVAVVSYLDSKEKQDKIEYLNTVPTQAPDEGPCSVCTLADPFITVTNEVHTSDPVSKEAQCFSTSLILSKIVEEIRGHPLAPFDTS